ncbi:MAG: hypothetical protein M1292_00810 [Bacteroidetes bacterium]|nr:hypothetical protein [Bacteroidota bacterium]
MPAKREYTNETKAIMLRFFEAVDMVISQKRIRGIQTYCTLAGIDRRHYYGQKKDLGRGWFQMSWMLPLLKEFSISSDWILLGKGGMFTVKMEKKEAIPA